MRKLAFPLTVLVIVVSVALYYYNSPGSSTIKGQQSDFAIEDTSSVTKIFLSDKANNNITLERQVEGGWKLNNQYVARQDAINNILETIMRISVRAPVPNSAFEVVVKNLAGNSTKVEIYQREKTPSKVYYVGGPNKAHSGTYMLMENSDVPFLIHIEGFHGFVSPRYFTNENDWINNVVFQYEYGSIASVQLEYPAAPGNSFKISVSEDDNFRLFKLEGDEEIEIFNEVLAKQFVSQFKKVPYESFEETRSKEYLDSVITNLQPLEIYTVTDRSGKVKQAKTFRKPVDEGFEDIEGNLIDYDMNRMLCLIDRDDVVVVQYFIFDNLKLSINDFIEPPIADNK